MLANVPSCKRWTDEGYKDKIMRDKLMYYLQYYEMPYKMALMCSDKILDLISENTGGVSDDSTESGVLHGVRESLANDRTDTVSQSSVDGTLEKITCIENKCNCQNTEIVAFHGKFYAKCIDCGNVW